MFCMCGWMGDMRKCIWAVCNFWHGYYFGNVYAILAMCLYFQADTINNTVWYSFEYYIKQAQRLNVIIYILYRVARTVRAVGGTLHFFTDTAARQKVLGLHFPKLIRPPFFIQCTPHAPEQIPRNSSCRSNVEHTKLKSCGSLPING